MTLADVQMSVTWWSKVAASCWMLCHWTVPARDEDLFDWPPSQHCHMSTCEYNTSTLPSHAIAYLHSY